MVMGRDNQHNDDDRDHCDVRCHHQRLDTKGRYNQQSQEVGCRAEGGDIHRRLEEAEAHYHGCYGVVVFDPSDAVRVRTGEPVAASYGAGADRRHDPRHLRQPLFHSAGVLVYLQEKGGESMISNDCKIIAAREKRQEDKQ